MLAATGLARLAADGDHIKGTLVHLCHGITFR
jgi:hypothetical protein